MTSPPPPDPVEARVRALTDTTLARAQRRLAAGVDRYLPALLSRNTAPDDPGLWLALDLTGLHPSSGPGLDEPAYRRAASAVTAAAQIWARTDVPHARASAERASSLGAVLARVARAHPTAEEALARALRAHTLAELLPRLRPLIGQARQLGLALDYGLLAVDLHTWQSPDGPHRTGRRWAHAFTQAKARAHRTTSTSRSPHREADPS